MNHFSNLMCCGDDAVEDAHEMELLKDVNGEALPNLDETIHWKVVDSSVQESATQHENDASDSSFVFDGENPAWLISEPFVFVGSAHEKLTDEELKEKSEEDERYYDDSGHISSTSDLTSGDSIFVSSVSSAEYEINTMIQSPTDPVGKVRTTYVRSLRVNLTKFHGRLVSAPALHHRKVGSAA